MSVTSTFSLLADGRFMTLRRLMTSTPLRDDHPLLFGRQMCGIAPKFRGAFERHKKECMGIVG
jgi:hypothetical protein